MFFYPEFENGEKILSRMDGLNADMLMNVSVFLLKKGDVKVFSLPEEELALLLLSGEVTFEYDGQTDAAKRKDVFSEKPYALHVSCGTTVKLCALSDVEIIAQSTTNDRAFPAKFYRPEDCIYATACDGMWDNTARRSVATVFDFENAPYSNMVLGEIYAEQGRWYSYIPHSHPQPEIYYYKYERPEGFGACFIGETAYTVKDGSCGCFTGGLNHPQVTAPGYPQYCCWMIRHLDDNPWTSRVDDERFTWLLDRKITYR